MVTPSTLHSKQHPTSLSNVLKPLSSNEEGILNNLLGSGMPAASEEHLNNFLSQNTPSKQLKASNNIRPSIVKSSKPKPLKSKLSVQNSSVEVSSPTFSARTSSPKKTPPFIEEMNVPAAALMPIEQDQAAFIPQNTQLAPVSLQTNSRRETSPRCPTAQHAPKVASLLNPSSPPRARSPAQSSYSTAERPLLRNVLVKGLHEASAGDRYCHPRQATVLGNKRWGRRPQPYSHDYAKRRASPLVTSKIEPPSPSNSINLPTHVPFAAHFDNTQTSGGIGRARGKKLIPRLPYLERELQENFLHRALRHVERAKSPRVERSTNEGDVDGEAETHVPTTGDGSPSPDTLPSFDPPPRAPPPPVPPPVANEPPPFEKTPLTETWLVSVEELSEAVGLHFEAHPANAKVNDVQTVPQSVAESGVDIVPASSIPQRPPSPSGLVALEVGAPGEDEGTDLNYSDPNSGGQLRQDELPTIAIVPRELSPPRDEGYEGSETSETDIDELEGEDEGVVIDTHQQIPAYRQPIPRIKPPVPSASVRPHQPSISKDLHNVLFLHPQKRKHELLDAPTGYANKKARRTNWAQEERALSPMPEPREGWDKTKRVSKNVKRSKAYYADPAAKAVQPPTEACGKGRVPFLDWMKAVRTWLDAGESLFNVDTAADNIQGRQRAYERSLRLALKADEGFILGVKSAKATTLTELGFVQFLRRAKDCIVDERWGQQAVELKGSVRGYWEVVEGRC